MGLIEFLRGQFAPGKGGGALPYGDAPDPTLSLIQSFEGFRETPYWDVNALRAGYGSDTITLPDGTVQRVGDGTRVSREDADRDLQRRVETEFMPIAARAVGQDAFAALAPHQKAALTSIAYNYGELPSSVAAAVQSGDPNAVAAAIAALGSHNDGINAGRRKSEAEFYLTGVMGEGGGPAVVASTKGGAPVNGLLGVPPEQDASGLIGLLTGEAKPWAGKLNDIGAVLLALSGSPAAQPLMEQLNKRKDAKREDARLNQTAAWLASMGRDDLASAVMAGGLSGSDAAAIAMTPAETPAPTKGVEVDGKLVDPVTGKVIYEGDPAAAEVGFRRATPEEAATYGAAGGQFGPDGRFYPVDVPQGMTVESDGQGGVRIVQGPAGAGGGLTSANQTDVNKTSMAYNSIVNGLDEYEKIFSETGGQVVPGAKKDALLTARRGLQLQLKELFNLGVINGPDLAILDALLVDPTSLTNNALDALGIAPIDERITSNLGQVRTLLKQIVDAKISAGSGSDAPASGAGTVIDGYTIEAMP